MAISFPANATNGQTHVTGEQTWRFDGTAWSVLNSGGSSGGSVAVDEVAPVSPTLGSFWFDTDSGDLSLFYSNSWIEINSSTGVLISNIVPQTSQSGRLWYDTETGDISVSVGNSWVELVPNNNFRNSFALNYINT